MDDLVDCGSWHLVFCHCHVRPNGPWWVKVLFCSLLLLGDIIRGFLCNPIVGEFLKTKVRGKICPRCGKPGSIVYQTKERIVFECPNGHQFEMKLGKKSGNPY